jgi:hypothetical protein
MRLQRPPQVLASGSVSANSKGYTASKPSKDTVLISVRAAQPHMWMCMHNMCMHMYMCMHMCMCMCMTQRKIHMTNYCSFTYSLLSY